jgi:hypothetical protein
MGPLAVGYWPSFISKLSLPKVWRRALYILVLMGANAMLGYVLWFLVNGFKLKREYSSGVQPYWWFL